MVGKGRVPAGQLDGARDAKMSFQVAVHQLVFIVSQKDLGAYFSLDSSSGTLML